MSWAERLTKVVGGIEVMAGDDRNDGTMAWTYTPCGQWVHGRWGHCTREGQGRCRMSNVAYLNIAPEDNPGEFTPLESIESWLCAGEIVALPGGAMALEVQTKAGLLQIVDSEGDTPIDIWLNGEPIFLGGGRPA